MAPALGRMVLYTSDVDLSVAPAVINDLGDDNKVGLYVFSAAARGPYPLKSVPLTDEEAGSEEARGKYTWASFR